MHYAPSPEPVTSSCHEPVLRLAQNLKPVADRLAAQNALFEESIRIRSAAIFPSVPLPTATTATTTSSPNTRSTRFVQRHKTDEDFLARLEAIPTTGFSDQDQLSHDLLVRVLQQRIADFDLKEYEMPINQQNGIHTGLADLPLSVPFDSVKHYEDYIARLHQIPRVLSQTTEVLRAGMKDKLMPVRFLARETSRAVSGHHRRRSVSACRQRISREHFRSKTRSA